MNANADAQWRSQLALQRSIDFAEALRHQPGGAERVAAGRGDIALDPEQRHDAIADEFVDPPAGAFDRLAHRREIAVEQEDDIVG